MYAASLGFAANWTDTPSIPIADFVRAGLNRDSRQALSDGIRRGNDVLFYRHFHGPLYHYLLDPDARLGLSEHEVRTAHARDSCRQPGRHLFRLPWLVPGSAPLRSCCSRALSNQLFGDGVHRTRASSTVRAMLARQSDSSCESDRHRQRRYWYGAVVTAGLAFCTLEIGCVLLLTLAICCFVERDRWRADRSFVVKSLALFFATVLLVWPAAILRLSFVKAYAVMAYLAISRDSAWGHAGLVETWRTRIFDSPLECILILLGVMVWVANRRQNFYPVGIFAPLALAATLRVLTVTPRYSLVFIPALDLLAGLTLVPSLGPLRRPASLAVVTLAVAGLYGNAWYQVSRQPHNPNPRSAAVQTYIHQNELENKAVLAPQSDLPTLHYYFPKMRLRGYYGRAPMPSDRAGWRDASVIPAAEP